MLDLKKIHPRRWNLRLAWDWFMVWVALVNLGLILFDFTYLTFRPFYIRVVPAITRIYDPVLGITPHPMTTALMQEEKELRQAVFENRPPEAVQQILVRLRVLTYRVVKENPFVRSEQTYKLEAFKEVIADESGLELENTTLSDPWRDAVDRFWSDEREVLSSRFNVFESDLEPLLATNYFRAVDSYGRLQSTFWLIDLPFLLFFWLEFGTRWYLAMDRKLYRRWYFFPVLNWYDLIGLIPYTQFRVFRLFRVVSIYLRLHRSDLSKVGEDTISRGVKRISGILVEEISDAVAVRILTEVQTEIRDGTARKVLDEIVSTKRDQIETMVVAQIRDLVSNDATQERVRSVVRLNLEAAAESSTALRAVPLPKSLVHVLVRTTGQIVLETFLKSINTTLESDEGQNATKDLVRGMMDQMLEGPLRNELDALSREISLDVIEQVKHAVAEKKWAKE
jgi:hypothetical protein